VALLELEKGVHVRERIGVREDHRGGVVAEAGGVDGVEGAAAGAGAIEIRLHDQRIGIDGVEDHHGEHPRGESADGEAVAMTGEHGRDQPEQQHGHPDHERGRVEALLGKAELVAIELHAPQRRGADDQHQRHLRRGQDAERAVLFRDQPVGDEQHRHHQRDHQHQLEESVARVLRQADRIGDQEEVAELHGHEEGEQEVHERQRDVRLRRRKLEKAGTRNADDLAAEEEAARQVLRREGICLQAMSAKSS